MTGNEQPDNKKGADLAGAMGLDGLINGMASILGKFSELAEKGESLKRAHAETSADGRVATSYGFSVKFGPGKDKESHVEPIIKPVAAHARPAQQSPTQSTREPHVEVFDEADHVLVVAEMPGVSSDDVAVNFLEKNLTIQGKSKTAQFQKVLELPAAFGPDDVAISSNNGVIEIRLAKS